jgi:hypothetical protein
MTVICKPQGGFFLLISYHPFADSSTISSWLYIFFLHVDFVRVIYILSTYYIHLVLLS